MCVCMGRGEGCIYAWSCCSPACITIVPVFVQVLDHALAVLACCFPHAKLKLGLLIRFLVFFMALLLAPGTGVCPLFLPYAPAGARCTC